MDKKTIRNILLFMERVNLKGSEVRAFVECINELNFELGKDIENKQ